MVSLASMWLNQCTHCRVASSKDPYGHAITRSARDQFGARGEDVDTAAKMDDKTRNLVESLAVATVLDARFPNRIK